MRRSRRRPAIITCAITGSVHVPSLSPALPVSPEEIAESAIEAADAGAAIVHLHARAPGSGRPTADPEVFGRFVGAIREGCDAVINITTGGSSEMTLDERLRAALELEPELCSCNMGSMNFGLFDMVEAHGRDRFEREWEVPFLEKTRELIFRNTFADIETILRELGDRHGVRFEFECYDVGHLHTLARMAEGGIAKPPFFVQFVLGIAGGIGAHLDHLVHMRQTADRLLGDDYLFSVLAAGRHQMALATAGAVMGGSVRVGLEDSLYIGPGELASSNAQQVHKIRRILTELSIPLATPDEARSLLGLKGRGRVVSGPHR